MVLMVFQWCLWFSDCAYGSPVVLIWCSYIIHISDVHCKLSCTRPSREGHLVASTGVVLTTMWYFATFIGTKLMMLLVLFLQVLRTVSEIKDGGKASHDLPNHKTPIAPIGTEFEETDGK